MCVCFTIVSYRHDISDPLKIYFSSFFIILFCRGFGKQGYQCHSKLITFLTTSFYIYIYRHPRAAAADGGGRSSGSPQTVRAICVCQYAVVHRDEYIRNAGGRPKWNS